MPRHGAVIFGDLENKLEVLQVACSKCDRRGQYPVAKLIERNGREAKLVDWKDTITADCPRLSAAGQGARGGDGSVWRALPDLLRLGI